MRLFRPPEPPKGVRVSSRFDWGDIFDRKVSGVSLLIEVVFFIWVACQIGRRIAYGGKRTKWAIPLAAAVILLAVEITLHFKVVLPERARRAEERRRHFPY